MNSPVEPLVDSRAAWIIASAALAISSIGFASPLVVAVAMKPIAAELETSRSIVSGVVALSYLGSAFGGILAGWLAGKFGVRRIVIFGTAMMALGLAVSSQGGIVGIYVGMGLLAGLLGVSAVGSPLLTYVSLWFVKRRGSAVALI